MTPIEIDQGLWAFEQIVTMPPGLQLPTRSHVVRLSDGGLVILSPIPELVKAKAQIDALGEVRGLLAHTGYHHLGLSRAVEAWPDAPLFGIPKLAQKRPDLTFQGTLDEAPDPLWRDVLDQHVLAGVPGLGEVVFFHRPSRTLILGDLAFHVPRPEARLSRWVFKLTGSWGPFGPSRLVKTTFKDRPALARSIRTLLAWEPARIVMAHGLPVEEDAVGELRRAFAFLER